jgi:hypothetical protein
VPLLRRATAGSRRPIRPQVFRSGSLAKAGQGFARQIGPAKLACPRKMILVAFQFFAFLHTQGQKQTSGNDGLLRCSSSFFDQCCHFGCVRKKDRVAARKFNDLRFCPLRHESLEVRIDHSVLHRNYCVARLLLPSRNRGHVSSSRLAAVAGSTKVGLQNFLSPTEHHAGSAVGTLLSSIGSNAGSNFE